jgi:branched-chain amino acid transport system permease protein
VGPVSVVKRVPVLKRGPVIGVGAAVVTWLAAELLLPRGLPPGVMLIGCVLGLINALGAIGLILVYRAGKYVNFAQAGFGSAGAVLAFRLISANRWNWFLAVGLGLVVSIALAGVSEVLFIQRLFKAPRLILTVATIGIAQFVAFFELWFNALSKKGTLNKFDPPLHVRFRLNSALFSGAHVLVLVIAPIVIVGLIVFFRRSRYGAVVQAAAENSDRARLLGVSVRSISTATWVTCGALSGIAAILTTPVTGLNVGGGAGAGLLLRALAPAMIAGLTSLPVAVLAALVLGIVEQAMAFNMRETGPIELVFFAIILAVLLLRPQTRGRTTEAEERSFGVSTVIRPFPRELARIPALRLARQGTRVALLAVAVLFPLTLKLSGQNLATAVLLYMIAALSITVLTGYAGQVSFGQWAMVGFGALLGGGLATQHHLPFAAGLVLIPLAGAALAVVIGLPALRIRGIFLGVTTLAFGIASQSYLFQRKLFHLDVPVTRPHLFGSELRYYYFCLGVLVLTMAGLRNLRASAIGRSMVAVRDNDRAAASYGVDLMRAKLSAFAVSGFLAALSGYLYVYNAGKLDPGSFPALTSLLLFSAVVIGGLGSQAGAILAAIYFRGVSYFLPGYAQFLATSVGLLLILLFLPGGIGSLFFGLRDMGLRWYAARRRIRVPSLVADTREDQDGAEEAALGTPQAPELAGVAG